VEVITIDGMDEHDFRHSIEDMLRNDEVDEAADKLRSLLEPYTREGGILPTRFRSVCSDDIVFAGWDRLEEKLAEHDSLDHPITGLGIAVADPREAGERAASGGSPRPCIETSYFSDNAYPFSESTREDLLEGYSRQGCQWQGDYEASDTALALEGIDDLYAAVEQLEARLMNSDEPAEEEIRAGSLGACYLAVIVHQAVRDAVRGFGLPRSLCVMAGCNGVYPFFDAPVAGVQGPQGNARVEPEFGAAPDFLPGDESAAEDGPGDTVPEEASLLTLVSRKGRKKPVITLSSADAGEASRLDEFMAMQSLNNNGRQTQVGLPVHLPAPVPRDHEIVSAFSEEHGGMDADDFPVVTDLAEETYDRTVETEPDELLLSDAFVESSRARSNEQDGMPAERTDDPAHIPVQASEEHEYANMVASAQTPVHSVTYPDVVELDSRQVVPADLECDIPAQMSVSTPGGHSLRKRIVSNTPKQRDTSRGWIRPLLRWILALASRRAKTG